MTHTNPHLGDRVCVPHYEGMKLYNCNSNLSRGRLAKTYPLGWRDIVKILIRDVSFIKKCSRVGFGESLRNDSYLREREREREKAGSLCSEVLRWYVFWK